MDIAGGKHGGLSDAEHAVLQSGMGAPSGISANRTKADNKPRIGGELVQSGMVELGGKQRILLADGDLFSRTTAASSLTVVGFVVHQVSNGLEAAAALLAPGTLDLAIIDVGLCGVTGRSLIEAIHSSDGIPLIAIGAREPFQALPRGIIFLTKPFHLSILLRTIRELRSTRSAGQQRRGGVRRLLN